MASEITHNVDKFIDQLGLDRSNLVIIDTGSFMGRRFSVTRVSVDMIHKDAPLLRKVLGAIKEGYFGGLKKDSNKYAFGADAVAKIKNARIHPSLPNSGTNKSSSKDSENIDLNIDEVGLEAFNKAHYDELEHMLEQVLHTIDVENIENGVKDKDKEPSLRSQSTTAGAPSKKQSRPISVQQRETSQNRREETAYATRLQSIAEAGQKEAAKELREKEKEFKKEKKERQIEREELLQERIKQENIKADSIKKNP